MMDRFTGEFAALTTSICWSLGSTFFTIAALRVGAVVLNRMRLVFALVFLVIMHFILQGSVFPFHVTNYQLAILVLSGILGMALGDVSMFQSFIMVGTHLGMLIMSSVPIISLVIAWIFLGERLSVDKIFAILLTVFGIGLVVWGKSRHGKNVDIKRFAIGVLFAFGGAMGQATGLALSRIGIVGREGTTALSGISATVIRVLAASIAIWLFTVFTGKVKRTQETLKSNPKAIWAMVLGAFAGPFLGMWFSMVAIKHTYIGIASALMALPPAFLLPISHFVFKERITKTSIIGTFIAILGAALIFLL